MALLHRDRPGTAGAPTSPTGPTADDTGVDTVAGPGAPNRPAWSAAAPAIDEPFVVRKNSLGQTLRTILATALLVAIVAVAIANTDEVDVDLVFDRYDAPLAALVGGAAGAGFLIGALLAWRGRRVWRI